MISLFKGGDIMANDKLSELSMDFAVEIINLVKYLKEQRESIISNQIGRSGTSIGANVREAKYAPERATYQMMFASQTVTGSAMRPSSRIVVTFTNHRFASLLLAWLTSLRKNDYQSFLLVYSKFA